jgi:hypothetical protein
LTLPVLSIWKVRTFQLAFGMPTALGSVGNRFSMLKINVP